MMYNHSIYTWLLCTLGRQCGLHICEQYISWDRTSAMYSFFLTSVLLVLKVRLIRPRVWYALVIMILQ